jgi:DNA mismatch repair protein MSH6
MDADIAMSELDLIYMKGTKAHSGFPEVIYLFIFQDYYK